jgi:hypothetical protein
MCLQVPWVSSKMSCMCLQVVFGVEVLDAMGQLIKGLDDVLEVMVCGHGGGTSECSKESVLSPVIFQAFDSQGRSQGAYYVQCPVEQDTVVMELSLNRYFAVKKLRAVITCGACRDGESKTEEGQGLLASNTPLQPLASKTPLQLSRASSKRTWYCKRCSVSQYVVDPNNPAHSCHDCPAGKPTSLNLF